MADISIEDKLYSSISLYCSLNGIIDVNGFINDMLSKGFSIMKNGCSPMDKITFEKDNGDIVTDKLSFGNSATKVIASDNVKEPNRRKVKITIKKKVKDD